MLMERCQSGRTGLTRNQVCSLRVPRVRIPPSPRIFAAQKYRGGKRTRCGSRFSGVIGFLTALPFEFPRANLSLPQFHGRRRSGPG